VKKGPWNDTHPHPDAFENMRRFPAEERLRYAGQYIVFSWDGTQILASGETRAALRQRVAEAGLDPSRLIWTYVDRGDEVYF
jgi:hypothetical protein